MDLIEVFQETVSFSFNILFSLLGVERVGFQKHVLDGVSGWVPDRLRTTGETGVEITP